MSLLELASSPQFACEKLVVGVDKTCENAHDVADVTRDLGWVGFELLTLQEWTITPELMTSERWVFLSMDV